MEFTRGYHAWWNCGQHAVGPSVVSIIIRINERNKRVFLPEKEPVKSTARAKPGIDPNRMDDASAEPNPTEPISMATLPKAGLKLATQADVDGRHQRKAQKVPKTMRSVLATLIDIYPCRSFIEMHYAKHINLQSSTDKVCIICIQEYILYS